ncbi:hypothetical protein BaRGS_00000753 [Batillaria attramentaria]|uniref:Uncharacterized protein n=1 Tax=Batillaria attramentaria TaxID=370345 RepID=A0ABD0M7N9_9CAEN
MAASAVSNMSVCGSPGITDSHQSECPNYLAKLQTSLKNQMNESYHSVWKSHPELRASNGLWSKFSTEKESGILKTGWLIALSVEVLCHKFDFLSLPEVLRIEGLDMLGMPQGTMTSEGGETFYTLSTNVFWLFIGWGTVKFRT